MDAKVGAKKEALQDLIKMLQGMMVKEGMDCGMEGNEAGNGSMEEVVKATEKEVLGDDMPDEEFEEYKKAQMKKTGKIKTSGKSMAIAGVLKKSAQKSAAPFQPSKMKRYS